MTDTPTPEPEATPPLAPVQPEVTTDTPEPSTTLPPEEAPFDGTEESRREVFEKTSKGQPR